HGRCRRPEGTTRRCRRPIACPRGAATSSGSPGPDRDSRVVPAVATGTVNHCDWLQRPPVPGRPVLGVGHTAGQLGICGPLTTVKPPISLRDERTAAPVHTATSCSAHPVARNRLHPLGNWTSVISVAGFAAGLGM